MKRIITLFMVTIMIFTVSACGDKSNSKTKSDEKSKTEGKKNNTEQNDEDIPVVGKTKVEIKSDRVIATSDDGVGNTAVTEYIYKDNALAEITMTMKCADEAAAKTLMDSYTTGDLKEYGQEIYSDISQDGKNVNHICKDSYISTFAGLTMEQLATTIEGGDIEGSNDSIEASDNTGTDSEEVEELKNNINWSELNLPDGFPKLADGVTSITENEGGFMLSWNAMSLKDTEKMIKMLEEWSGTSILLSLEVEGAKSWVGEKDNMSIAVNYWPNSFDVQTMITVQTY